MFTRDNLIRAEEDGASDDFIVNKAVPDSEETVKNTCDLSRGVKVAEIMNPENTTDCKHTETIARVTLVVLCFACVLVGRGRGGDWKISK